MCLGFFSLQRYSFFQLNSVFLSKNVINSVFFTFFVTKDGSLLLYLHY